MSPMGNNTTGKAVPKVRAGEIKVGDRLADAVDPRGYVVVTVAGVDSARDEVVIVTDDGLWRPSRHPADQLLTVVVEGIDLDAIRARLEAATPGPWETDGDGLVWPPRIGDPVSGSNLAADAEFIAHARQDIPALLAEVDRLRAELAAREVAQ